MDKEPRPHGNGNYRGRGQFRGGNRGGSPRGGKGHQFTQEEKDAYHQQRTSLVTGINDDESARKFLQYCLSTPDKTKLMKEIAEKRWYQIDALMDADYKIGPIASYSSKFSFEKVYIPFMKLIGDRDCVACLSQSSYLKLLVAIYSNVRFFWELSLECIFDWIENEEKRIDGIELEDFLLPLFGVLKAFVDKIPGQGERDIEFYKKVKVVFTEFGEKMKRDVKYKIEALLKTLSKYYEKQEIKPVYGEDADLPEYFRQGPKHDNDFPDFRKIAIFPTDEEINCDAPPYLPKREEDWDVEQFVDWHFRMYREDSLRNFITAIRHFQDIAYDRFHDLSVSSIKINNGKNDIKLMTYRRAMVVGLDVPMYTEGAAFVVEVDDFTKNDKVGKQKTSKADGSLDTFQLSGFLQMGALVCFASKVKNRNATAYADHLIFGTVIGDLSKSVNNEKIRVNVSVIKESHRILMLDNILEHSAAGHPENM